MPMTAPKLNPLRAIEAYLDQYVVFSNPAYSFVAALWVCATYLWPVFDAFPYLVISSPVKRSGKTRFSEVLDFVVRGGHRFTAATMPSIYSAIRDAYAEDPVTHALEPHGGAVIFLDEAETLSREDASGMRAVLNAGYRKGATVPRWSKTGVVQWPVYCPKVFILIGDVFDTLRDRSIVVEMWRGEPAKRFNYNAAKAEGQALGVGLVEAMQAARGALTGTYETLTLPFLGDRDEEIWLPLFAVCQALAPERVIDLQRVAADLATLKTQEKRTYRDLQVTEHRFEQDEYARRLLRDLASVLDGQRFIYTQDALTRLLAIPTAPWRTFRGTGLDPKGYNLADLLKPLGVAPVLIKSGTVRSGKKVARGYRRDDIERALAKL